jgi:hypothetical protein
MIAGLPAQQHLQKMSVVAIYLFGGVMLKKTSFILAAVLFVLISYGTAEAQLKLTYVNSSTRIPSNGYITGASKITISGVPNGTASFQVAFTSSNETSLVATACITKLYNASKAMIDNQTAVKYYRVQCEENGLQGGYTSANYSKPLIQLRNPMDPKNPLLPITVSPTINGAMWMDIKIPSGTAAGVYDGWFIAYPSTSNSVSLHIYLTVNDSVTSPPVTPESVTAPTAITGAVTTIAGKIENYTASGGVSNQGNAVLYRFNWGDGNISAWGNALQNHTWAKNGTFAVLSQARSTADTTKVSAWSGNLANVSVNYLTLNVVANPSGSGSVTKSPDKTTYSYNESVQLTGNAGTGYSLVNWSGDASGSTHTTSITMTANKIVTANFVSSETVSMPTGITGAAATFVGKGESYIASGAGSSLGHTLAYRFDWNDGTISDWGSAAQSHIWATNGSFAIKSQARCSEDTTKVSIWSENLKSITVNYLTLNVAVNSGSLGSVTKNPDKAGYSFNESVQLFANANTGYNFGNWSGDTTGSTNPLSIAMSSNKSITANFVGAVQLTAINSMTRVPRSGAVSGGSITVSIKAAKNEVESFQVAITSGSSQQVSDAVMSDLTNSSGGIIKNTSATLYRVEYVNITQLSPRAESGYTTGYYADPLIPFINPVTGKPINKSGGTTKYALPIDVSSSLNGAIWVDVKVPSTASAGVYTGSLTLTCSDFSKVAMPVTLTVWNFTLPDGPTSGSNFGTYGNITAFYGPSKGTTAYNAIERRYAEETARHRINPPIPIRFFPEGDSNGNLKVNSAIQDSLNQFITQNHLTSFQIPFESVPPGDLQANYFYNYTNYMKSNGWLEGAYYWPIDEPNTFDAYQYITIHTTHQYTGTPNVRTMVTEQPYTQNFTWPDISGSVDIWSQLIPYIDEGTVNQQIAKGKKVWSYTTLTQFASSIHPQYSTVKSKISPFWQIDRPLTNYRVPLWINYRYHITGLLYYTMMTSDLPDPWTNPRDNVNTGYNGEGMLYYPGTPCGFQGPVSSIRLKNIRDGMEDYEYMILLEKSKGYTGVMNYVNPVSSEWWFFSKNPNDFSTARENMGSMISSNPPISPRIISNDSENNMEVSKPLEYKVEAPYPNPFNPVTTISYILPTDSQVTLAVYSLSGQRVAVLKEESEKAGKYSVSWNASGCSSGLYFFTLKAKNYTKTCKVLLLK